MESTNQSSIGLGEHEIQNTEEFIVENMIISGEQKIFVFTEKGMKIQGTGQEKEDHFFPWNHIIKGEASLAEPESKFFFHFIEAQENKTLRVKSTSVTNKDRKAAQLVQLITEHCEKVPNRPKKLFVVINPIGGNAKGVKEYESKVAPIFALAGCETTVIKTEYAKHALDIGEKQDFSSYDGIVSVGGDGLYQELLQGYFLQLQKSAGVNIHDKDASFIKPKVPFCLIPSGSSNGMVKHTNKNVMDHETCALRALTGEIHHLNILTVHEPERFVGICALALGSGMMVDIMKRADELRWMKKARYIYAFITGLLKRRRFFKAQLEYFCVTDKGEDWIVHDSKGRDYVAVLLNVGAMANIGEKKPVDFFSPSGCCMVDMGASNLTFFKFAQIYQSGRVREELDKMDLIDNVLAVKVKFSHDDDKPDGNLPAAQARERELEHYLFLDGEIGRIEGSEFIVRMQTFFVPVFSTPMFD